LHKDVTYSGCKWFKSEGWKRGYKIVKCVDFGADADAEQAKSLSQLGGLTVLVVLLREGE